jgi:predicted RNase H-like HicB family nuclease
MTDAKLRVKFTHEGSDWLVEVMEEPRIHSFGRTLAKARMNIVDAAALWYEVHPESIEIVPVFDISGEAFKLLEQLQQARADAARYEEVVRNLTNQAVQELLNRRVSMRDAAEILQLSHQRIQQIAAKLAEYMSRLDTRAGGKKTPR